MWPSKKCKGLAGGGREGGEGQKETEREGGRQRDEKRLTKGGGTKREISDRTGVKTRKEIKRKWDRTHEEYGGKEGREQGDEGEGKR